MKPSTPSDPCALLDSDGDGLPDAWEVLKYRTDPAAADTNGDGISDGDWQARREFTYTVRVILEVAVPLPPIEELNTLFQDVRLLGQRGGVSELEVVLYPGALAGAEKYGVQNNCVLADFEDGEADPAFAAEMRSLTGAAPTLEAKMETLLDAVFGQTRRSVPFNAFYLSKDAGVVSVEPLARSALRDQEADPLKLWMRELDPATMWERRERGECTSSAVLGAAALEAIGVRSRLALFLPLFSASEETLGGIWDHRALGGLAGHQVGFVGCSSHTVVEVFDGDGWLLTDEERIRRTPFELGMGPLIQLRTAPTVEDLIEPALWGAACAGNGPLLGTKNVYRILHLSDAWGRHTEDLELPGIGRAPPREVMITEIFPFTSPKRPAFIPADAVNDPSRYYLAKAEIDEEAWPSIPYFYGCVDKSLPPFQFVRGHWGPYFLMEKVGDPVSLEAVPEGSAPGCRWVVEDIVFKQ